MNVISTIFWCQQVNHNQKWENGNQLTRRKKPEIIEGTSRFLCGRCSMCVLIWTAFRKQCEQLLRAQKYKVCYFRWNESTMLWLMLAQTYEINSWGELVVTNNRVFFPKCYRSKLMWLRTPWWEKRVKTLIRRPCRYTPCSANDPVEICGAFIYCDHGKCIWYIKPVKIRHSSITFIKLNYNRRDANEMIGNCADQKKSIQNWLNGTQFQ